MAETELKIRVIGEPVLRKKARKVETVTQQHRLILSQMARTMYGSQGIGLAAPQVDISEALIVVDVGTGLYKLVNPKIIKKEGNQAIEEGCLSVPGVSIKVKRAKNIILEALDENGVFQMIQAKDLLACVFQHEIDHLNGKLIVDYAPLWKRLMLKKKAKSL